MNVDPNDPIARNNGGEMSGREKTSEELDIRQLTKGEKAHAIRIGRDPDM